MTALSEPFSSEGQLSDMLSQPWARLFGDDCDDSPKSLPKPRPDSRLPSNVKCLPVEEMPLFGRCPEKDPFVTIVCSFCGCVLMQPAFQRHVLKRHSEGPRPQSSSAESKSKTAKKSSPPKKCVKSAPSSPPEFTDEDSTALTETVGCSLCSMVVSSQSFRRHVIKVHADDASAKPLKIKTAKKPTPPKKVSKSAASSPPELTEEFSKESKKLVKTKKSKSPIPPELEPILPAAKRITQVGSGPPELMPQELPKKSSKKKLERKADKVYDANKNCGVLNDSGKPCLRSILCKVHLVALKRAVPNRTMPYDALTKLLKTQNDEEKRPKLEVVYTVPVPIKETKPVIVRAASPEWCEPPSIKQEEPPAKRVKTVELEEEQYELPSDLDALIEATLKDVEENEPLPVIPSVPRPEPILRWSYEAPPQLPFSSCSPPPHFEPEDIMWHATHPRPLATHTYGCRLLGGLLSTNKKGFAFRKNVESVLVSRSGFSDSSNKLPGFSLKSGLSSPKKSQTSSAANRRKRKGSTTADVVSGLFQRQPTSNGVPLRLLPVQQPTFIQLNLCPSK